MQLTQGRMGADCTPTLSGFLGHGEQLLVPWDGLPMPSPQSCVHKERNTVLGGFGTKDQAGVLGVGGGIRQGLLWGAWGQIRTKPRSKMRFLGWDYMVFEIFQPKAFSDTGP